MFKSILVPIDVEHESSWKTALPEAIELARESTGQITSVAVLKGSQFMVPGAGEPSRVEIEVSKTRNRLISILSNYQNQIEINHDVRIGRIGPQILHAATSCNADLIVMASRGSPFTAVRACVAKIRIGQPSACLHRIFLVLVLRPQRITAQIAPLNEPPNRLLICEIVGPIFLFEPGFLEVGGDEIHDRPTTEQ